MPEDKPTTTTQMISCTENPLTALTCHFWAGLSRARVRACVCSCVRVQTGQWGGCWTRVDRCSALKSTRPLPLITVIMCWLVRLGGFDLTSLIQPLIPISRITLACSSRSSDTKRKSMSQKAVRRRGWHTDPLTSATSSRPICFSGTSSEGLRPAIRLYRNKNWCNSIECKQTHWICITWK